MSQTCTQYSLLAPRSKQNKAFLYIIINLKLSNSRMSINQCDHFMQSSTKIMKNLKKSVTEHFTKIYGSAQFFYLLKIIKNTHKIFKKRTEASAHAAIDSRKAHSMTRPARVTRLMKLSNRKVKVYASQIMFQKLLKARKQRRLLCVLTVPASSVIGVDVHRLSQGPFDDPSCATDERLETRRQHDGLLLISAQLTY